MTWPVEAPFGADLAAAWFGIAGVVVGAITTGLVSYRVFFSDVKQAFETAAEKAGA